MVVWLVVGWRNSSLTQPMDFSRVVSNLTSRLTVFSYGVFAFCISGVLDTDEKVDIFAGNILVLVVMFAVGVFCIWVGLLLEVVV
jgi:hypothetical protein